MVQRVYAGEMLISLILRSGFKSPGIHFFTPDDFSQQLGYMLRPKGYVVAPHVHNLVVRKVEFTQEVLFIKTGKVRVDFYDGHKNYIESHVLSMGDVVLLAYGGHGLEILEEAEIIEVKQGPYSSEQDKVRFDPVVNSEIKLKEWTP